MKKPIKTLLFLSFPLFVTGCGFSLSEVYPGNVYNNSDFTKNYYEVWDSSLKNATLKNNIDVTNNCFTKLNSPEFYAIAGEHNYSYLDDLTTPLDPSKTSYGQSIRMSNYDDIFKFGIMSKLYDGQLFCHSNYQLSRVQINENGFGTKFKKEGTYAEYFMLNLKGAVISKTPTNSVGSPLSFDIPESFMMNTNLVTKIYTLSDQQKVEYTKVTATIDIRANYVSETEYTCFGFKIKDTLDLNRIIGVSIEYSINNLTMFDGQQYSASTYTLDNVTQALFLYELSFVNSTWN